MSEITSFNFNTLQFCRDFGRTKAPILMTYYIMKSLKIDKLPQLDLNKLLDFVSKIYKGYNKTVQYHNDMHGADVLQMVYLFLTKGNLTSFAQLSDVDILVTLMSAMCHDFNHDGFTNSYHVNSMSEFAVCYSDNSVNENMHAAESFAILNQQAYNFLHRFERDEYKTFRMRFLGIILATDMARHSSDFAKTKSMVEEK